MGGLDETEFWRFAARLKINSKEFGAVKLARPFGPQRYLIYKIAQGLENDIHEFSVLKSRQLGATTVLEALDLWWPWKHGGMDGTIITQDEQTFVKVRTELSEMYAGLPRAYKPFSPSHNRTEFTFRLADGTMSRIQYQIAGGRIGTATRLGRAKGNSFAHGTEVAFWADQDALEILKNSLAEINPARLYVWESTANGFDAFEQQWRIAVRSPAQRGIFLGWWAHELNQIPRDDSRFDVYYGKDGHMTLEEQEWAREIVLDYGDALEYIYGRKEIVPEQVAWWRFYGEEQLADPELMKQERPWTPGMAFVTTGSQFFRGADLTRAYKRIGSEERPRGMRIEIGSDLEKCEVVAAPARVCNLWVYAGPVQGGHYVLGADPAYGVSEWSDGNCISVWRCWAERCEQVAEFWANDFQPFAFAWAMVYLAGMYSPCGWNLEVTGPGTAVLGEIENLKRQRFDGAPNTKAMLTRFFGGMREFLYTRVDSLNRNPIAKGTQSNYREKTRYMESFRDNFTRGLTIPHSRGLLEEMRWITRQVGQAPAGTARHPDDRVIGAALANFMWMERMRMGLLRAGVSYEAERQKAAGEPIATPPSVLQTLIQKQIWLLQNPPPQRPGPYGRPLPYRGPYRGRLQ